MRQSLAHAVRDLLCRHARDEADRDTLTRLGVPDDWINEAEVCGTQCLVSACAQELAVLYYSIIYGRDSSWLLWRLSSFFACLETLCACAFCRRANPSPIFLHLFRHCARWRTATISRRPLRFCA